MRDWYVYWNEDPKQYAEIEFLRQVGKTVGGIPISDALVARIAAEIIERLSLSEQDRVLDLCCGNGVISSGVSHFCKQLVSVDFSETLINIARKHHSGKNIEYFCRSVLDPAFYIDVSHRRISKIYMYEGLQHFRVEDLSLLLRLVKTILPADDLLFLGSIPDTAKLWDFYNTEQRRADYFRRSAQGTEAIGTWWDQEQLCEICESQGFRADILSQSDVLHTAHYRFDALIRNLH